MEVDRNSDSDVDVDISLLPVMDVAIIFWIRSGGFSGPRPAECIIRDDDKGPLQVPSERFE